MPKYNFILSEAFAKKKKLKSKIKTTYTTGDIVSNIAHFNKELSNAVTKSGTFLAQSPDGASTIPTGSGTATASTTITEAKRYVRRYFIRPQHIFCSNKAEIIKALLDIDEKGGNCTVYTLNNLGDIKDVTKLTNNDIIYFYDNGILYDKNHVKVLDYDLYIKHEENRDKINPDNVSDSTFKAIYADRMTAATELEEGMSLNDHPLTETIETHDELNPKLWNVDGSLKPEVAEKIKLIVDTFLGELQEDQITIKVSDIILIGSNASYNYTDKSDLDIHIIADTKNLVCPDKLHAKLYSAYRSLFNKKLNIEFYGIPVELYVETEDTKGAYNGVYSVVQNKWLEPPVKEEIPPVDTKTLNKELAKWEQHCKEVISLAKQKLHEELHTKEIDAINSLITDIYNQRKEGLPTEGQYGTKNLIFKELRNKGYLDTLKDLKNKLMAQELSLESLNEACYFDSSIPTITEILPINNAAQKEILGDLVKTFGLLKNAADNQATYILSDGRILNTATDYPYNSPQHETIAKYISNKYGFDDLDSNNGSRFMNSINAIRITSWIPSISLPPYPLTEAQNDCLQEFILSPKVQITDKDPLFCVTFNYKNRQYVQQIGWPSLVKNCPDAAIMDINDYYTSGKLRSCFIVEENANLGKSAKTNFTDKVNQNIFSNFEKSPNYIDPNNYLKYKINEAVYGMNGNGASFKNIIKTLFKQKIIDIFANTTSIRFCTDVNSLLTDTQLAPKPFFTFISNPSGAGNLAVSGLIQHHILYGDNPKTIAMTIQSHTKLHNTINAKILAQLPSSMQTIYENYYVTPLNKIGSMKDTYSGDIIRLALFEDCIRRMATELQKIGLDANTLKSTINQEAVANMDIFKNADELKNDKSRLNPDGLDNI